MERPREAPGRAATTARLSIIAAAGSRQSFMVAGDI